MSQEIQRAFSEYLAAIGKEVDSVETGGGQLKQGYLETEY